MVSFFLTALLLSLTPGPDNIYLLNLSLQQGTKKAFLFLLGLCSGLVIHTFIAAFGLGIVIVSNEDLFFALKVIGSFYLLYIAWSLLQQNALPQNQSTKRDFAAKIYLQGVMMNLSNPKVLLFFLSFLPQFITTQKGYMIQVIQLGGLFILAAFLVFSVFALLAKNVAPFFKDKIIRKRIHYLSAFFLTFVAVQLVLG